MGVSNSMGEVVTYAGGCGPGHVDINPQYRVKEMIPVEISAALYDERDQQVASSHGPFYNKGSVYPGTWITDARWVATVPPGGRKIEVFVQFGDTLLTDTVHVET